MDGAVNAAPAKECFVGGVDDGVGGFAGDVALCDFEKVAADLDLHGAKLTFCGFPQK
jgi:hypothetical protein